MRWPGMRCKGGLNPDARLGPKWVVQSIFRKDPATKWVDGIPVLCRLEIGRSRGSSRKEISGAFGATMLRWNTNRFSQV